MKTLLKLEELGLGVAALAALSLLDTGLAWGWYVPLFFAPDVSMLAYLGGGKVGAVGYNVFHHKAVALGVVMAGLWVLGDVTTGMGLLLLAHSCLDRMLGYGLKYATGFKFTHLGEIGGRG